MEEFLYRAKPWAITLVAHNWPVLSYALLIPFAAIHAFLRPSRPALLLLYGLLMLAFAFEYEKHGVRVMLDTTRYLFSEERNPGPRYASQLVFVDGVPLVAHALGIAAIVVSVAPFAHSGKSR